MTVVELPEFDDRIFSRALIMYYLVGTVVGYVCKRTMLHIMKNKKFEYFAFYYFIVGIISFMYVIISKVKFLIELLLMKY